MHYLKFFLFHLLGIVTILSIALGGTWLFVGYLGLIAFMVLGDLCLGVDDSIPKPKSKWLYNLQLWLALPLVAALIVVCLKKFGTDGTELSGILAKPEGGIYWLEFIISVFFAGLLISTLGTVTAHELVHRKWGCISHSIGRWLLAFSLDSNFAIEHVFGHHINIATDKDPASAPRGRTVYEHIWRSTVDGNASAWRIEQKRLDKAGLSLYSWHNRFLLGVLQSILLLVLAFFAAGWTGLLFFVLTGLVAKSMLEVVNYMEHYGLVRVPGKRVFPRHSWNTNTKISSWAMFNLTRHAHHHANANVPFQNLKPFPDAPSMPSGYLGTMFVTLLPPLWFKIMHPKLAHWDCNYASEEEKRLLEQQGKLMG